MGAQPRNSMPNNITNSSTTSAADSLQALSLLILERRSKRNQCATNPEKPRNFYPPKVARNPLERNCVISSQNNEVNQGITVICYTPNGNPIEVTASSPEHAAWLLRMNPKPFNEGEPS
jgi:hypothetical protein